MKSKTVFIFAIIIAVFLCSCKEKTPDIESQPTVISKEESVTNDVSDPENTELSEEIGTKVEAESLTPQSGKANGIDVSKWQGKIDWKKVRSAGIDFAIIRVGYRAENGVIYKDSYADYNIQQADKAGILVGVYFFSTAVNKTEALEEAKWTIKEIESYPISYPVVYDCEGFTLSSSRMYALSKEERSQNAATFLAHIESLGYEGMLYASKNELINHWNISALEKDFKIWIARYTASPYPQTPVPDYSGRYDMWQYTNMGKVNGINGNTDMVVSYFERNKAKPKSDKAVNIAQPPAEKDQIYTAANDSVTAKEVVNLRENAGTNYSVVGSLKNGEFLTRIGIGSNGWSKLSYNGKTVYAITSYLTTDRTYTPPVSEPDDGFESVNEQVTPKISVNLRSSASASSSVVATVSNGQVLTRIGIGNNGWSRLTYNGQTVYAVTSYLTTDLRYTPPKTEEPSVSDKNEMQFTNVDEQVTAKSETNLRTKPTTGEGSQVVHTLKNGEYITRTGVSASGWSRLSFNGQTVYAISSYLTN